MIECERKARSGPFGIPSSPGDRSQTNGSLDLKRASFFVGFLHRDHQWGRPRPPAWGGLLNEPVGLEVPVPLRGRGIGARLVKDALLEARHLKLKVVPQCWFVREFVDRNPEFADVLR